MASEDKGRLRKKKTCSGIKFTDKDPLSVFLKPTTSFIEFLNSIIQKLELQGVKRVEKLFYQIPISVFDKDLEVLLHCHRQFSEVRTPELLAKLVDVVSSSGGSNRNPQAPATAAYSSSRLVGASSFVLVIAPEAMVVASPSFAADLNRNGDVEVGITNTAPVSIQGGTPDSIDDILQNDDDDEMMWSRISLPMIVLLPLTLAPTCPNTSSPLYSMPIWNIIHPIHVRNLSWTSLGRLD
ncbi:hypothetical protein Ahy_B02g061125 [Arachis hypogaea]|uniref:Uncharacterized protein n=1 Tax=Arachis hypogaea TaxID=3818 RepID=A0A445AK39_ARAHY|nr:hypothetical protein Ahy_B02g061125 [Arachis hypogaea]